MKACGNLLSFFKVWAGQHLQHLLDAPPAGPRQHLSQTHAERSVAAVHVRDVVGVLGESQLALVTQQTMTTYSLDETSSTAKNSTLFKKKLICTFVITSSKHINYHVLRHAYTYTVYIYSQNLEVRLSTSVRVGTIFN